MRYLADFARRKGSRDKIPRKRKMTSERANRQKLETASKARNILSTLNRTSLEIRGWVNTLRRLKRDREQQYYNY